MIHGKLLLGRRWRKHRSPPRTQLGLPRNPLAHVTTCLIGRRDWQLDRGGLEILDVDLTVLVL